MTEKPLSRATMETLRRQYAERLRTRAGAILDLLKEAEYQALTPSRRAELLNHAHSLAGSGATFGYPEISRAGKRLEEALDAGASEAGFLPLGRSLVATCRSIYATQPSPRRKTEDEPVTKDKQSIALVDDDPAVHDIIRSMFRGEFNISVALDGKEGLEMIRSQKPDLVLLDGTMLGMRGMALLEALQKDEETKAIPVVMLTAHNQSTYVNRAIGAGAKGYIVKPFNGDAVAKRIRSYLERPGTGSN